MTALTPRQERLTYTVEEAAKRLGVSRSYLHEQIAAPGFESRTGIRVLRIGRRIVISRRTLHAALGLPDDND